MKPALCKRCAADPKSPRRSCDEAGCGRVGCIHLVHRKGGNDVCGPCNLKKHRAAKKAMPPAPAGGAA